MAGGIEPATAARAVTGLARADLAGEKAERLVLDEEEDAGERLLVGLGTKERPGGIRRPKGRREQPNWGSS